jgi:deoxyribodipyrimidine photolyase-related protein
LTGTLRVVLGDQLTRGIASLRDLDRAGDTILMAEVADEATYVPHHPKKIAFLFSAMRHFAAELEAEGGHVRYVRLDAPGNTGSFKGEVARAVRDLGPERVVVTEPGEWRVAADMATWEAALGVPVEIRDDDRFYCSRARFAEWAGDRRQLRMEFFYRDMRRETGLLMAGPDEPAGGRWNFDAENRKPVKGRMTFPEPLRVAPDPITREVVDLVRDRFEGRHFGALEPFWFAVTAADARRALDHFVDHALPSFGDYQDAMQDGEDWLFHSALSQYLNAGLLTPREVCAAVERAWCEGRAPLNAVEGYIRQILGWREYVRGIYWLKMPGYAAENRLGAHRPLPAFYWTGATDMRCMAHSIDQTRREALSHHIQRLMVTGNFALLAGVEPAQICLWYLAVYTDAYEWVELPNVLGMVMHADGGYLGSKPYAASGAYIDRMSDFCRSCRYDVRQKNGADACPFNYLYWSFLIENRDSLGRNPRLGQIYRTLDRLDGARVAAIKADSARFLAGLEPWRPDA